MEELDGIVVWPGAAAQCTIKTFPGVHRDVFDLEDEGDNVVVCLSTLKVLPRFGSTLWERPADLRWTHNKFQRLFTGGQSSQDVAAMNCR